MTKITVLGGSGFLGSHLADFLSKKGYRVTIFDLHKSKWKKRGQKMIIGNILDEKKRSKAIKNSSYVFNFAALANMDNLQDKAEETVKYNILGTVKALKLCKKFKVKKFIHASTIYANTEEGGFYGKSKKAAEHYVEEYFNFYKLKYTILRFGSLYGERAKYDNGIRQILENIYKKKAVIYRGTKNSVRQYIYIKDAITLCYNAISKKYDNKYLNITGRKNIKSSKLMNWLSDLYGIPTKKIRYLENKGHYDRKPTLFKPRTGKYIYAKKPTSFEKKIKEYAKTIIKNAIQIK